MPWTAPVILENEIARLVPLSMDHCPQLTAAVADGNLWELWYTTIPRPEEMSGEIERRLTLQRGGSMLPFTVIERSSGDVAGQTTYMNIDAQNRRVEIGSTWYAMRVQRTALNTACKLLLLEHAFESLQCIAVEFRTSFFNVRSRCAIERLGAKCDGILRSHMFHADGTLRDTVVYSIIASEWPAVRSNLQGKLRGSTSASV